MAVIVVVPEVMVVEMVAAPAAAMVAETEEVQVVGTVVEMGVAAAVAAMVGEMAAAPAVGAVVIDSRVRMRAFN